MSCHRAHSTYRSVEEPLKQRTGNPQPVTTFLFEWAFSLEQGSVRRRRLARGAIPWKRREAVAAATASRAQRAAGPTELPSLVNRRAGLPTTYGFESSHVGLF